ncbi:hypothetical protein KR222_005233 [Zaprionus bogoriensis]|nr:hypothetical protein KR222_005233 [Zaprionus bogoriensis]
MSLDDEAPHHYPPLLNNAVIQFIAAGVSSVVEVFLLLPLDVIKTRLQLQSISPEQGTLIYYNGARDAIYKIYRMEGILGFWRGAVPPLLSDAPRWTLKYVIMEQSTPLFQFGSPKPTLLTYMLCGALAGFAECFVQTPFEVIKINQQAYRKHHLTCMAVAKRIVEKDGFGCRGLYRGFTATMIRNIIFHMIYIGYYCDIRDNMIPRETKWSDYNYRLLVAIVTSVIASAAASPFDVVKSKIQGPQPIRDQVKYFTLLNTFATVYKEEGFLSFYRGLLPQCTRSPGSAIVLLVYEYLNDYLEKNWV